MIKAVTNYQQFINNDTSFFCVLLGMAALMSSFVTLQVKNSGVLNTMDPQEKKVQEVGSLFLTFLKHFLSTGLMFFFSPELIDKKNTENDAFFWLCSWLVWALSMMIILSMVKTLVLVRC